LPEDLVALAGGADRLRLVLEDFFGRVFEDLMIGFLFAGKDRIRLVDKELELALAALGADVPYTGRPIREVHRALPILGGHFLRRQQLLRETMHDHSVPAAVAEALLRHNDSLRPLVTADEGSECRHDRATGDGRGS